LVDLHLCDPLLTPDDQVQSNDRNLWMVLGLVT
jgi:hypothetical protein